MTSLNRNFSIDKFYGDLEKYEANINGARNSRVKRNGSGSSLHRTSAGYPHVPLKKNYLQTNNTSKIDRVYRNRDENCVYSKKNCSFNESRMIQEKTNNLKIGDHPKTTSMFKDMSNTNTGFNLSPKENRASQLLFNKTDQATFLSQCKKMYNMEFEKEKEEDYVRQLLGEINKRDEIYGLVCKRLGNDCQPQTLKDFFLGYERMKAIIGQFKRMSKLEIDDEEELYNFLRSEQE